MDEFGIFPDSIGDDAPEAETPRECLRRITDRTRKRGYYRLTDIFEIVSILIDLHGDARARGSIVVHVSKEFYHDRSEYFFSHKGKRHRRSTGPQQPIERKKLNRGKHGQ